MVITWLKLIHYFVENDSELLKTPVDSHFDIFLLLKINEPTLHSYSK